MSTASIPSTPAHAAAIQSPVPAVKTETTNVAPKPGPKAHRGSYTGFIAGVASGVTKCLTGHPFDTIKVRLQTSDHSRFRGPVDCVMQTVRNEGLSGFYKGVTPPLAGWMFMDSLMLGSLTLYRRLLNEHIFNPDAPNRSELSATNPSQSCRSDAPRLSSFGHGIAGLGAGATVSFIAAPVEHVKARLQVQYEVDKSKRLYSGPVDCARKLIVNHGFFRGLYRGLSSTLIFRSFFFFWWASYDVFTQYMARNTNMSTPAINFWAGGLSAQVFWLTTYPTDVVKQRIMTDEMGKDARFPRWKDAASTIYRESGYKGFWRGCAPTMARGFIANAMALVAFEAVMRLDT